MVEWLDTNASLAENTRHLWKKMNVTQEDLYQTTRVLLNELKTRLLTVEQHNQLQELNVTMLQHSVATLPPSVGQAVFHLWLQTHPRHHRAVFHNRERHHCERPMQGKPANNLVHLAGRRARHSLPSVEFVGEFLAMLEERSIRHEHGVAARSR